MNNQFDELIKKLREYFNTQIDFNPLYMAQDLALILYADGWRNNKYEDKE